MTRDGLSDLRLLPNSGHEGWQPLCDVSLQAYVGRATSAYDYFRDATKKWKGMFACTVTFTWELT